MLLQMPTSLFYLVETSMERTLLIIKPDAVAQNGIGEIIKRLKKKGFKVIELQKIHLTRAQATEFYAVHKERPFYNDLLDFMTSGPAVPMVLERENAVAYLREVIGSTNPEEAESGTIRKDFGSNIQNNAVHASDSPENGRNEIAFFFGEKALS